MKAFKLTDHKGQTHGQTQWGPGATHSGTGKGDLCGPGWIHFYDGPLLAVFLNPVHAAFPSPRLWECRVSGKILEDHGLKFGAQTLTTLREIPVPEVTLEHRVRFAIFCALEVCEDSQFRGWVDRWLDGSDRSPEAATKALAGAAAEWVTVWSGLQQAARARAAESAAESAEWAARAAESEESAERAAAVAAAVAARAAERAAEWSAMAGQSIDMKAIARKAIQDESV
jgi:hypothetical protein